MIGNLQPTSLPFTGRLTGRGRLVNLLPTRSSVSGGYILCHGILGISAPNLVAGTAFKTKPMDAASLLELRSLQVLEL